MTERKITSQSAAWCSGKCSNPAVQQVDCNDVSWWNTGRITFNLPLGSICYDVIQLPRLWMVSSVPPKRELAQTANLSSMARWKVHKLN